MRLLHTVTRELLDVNDNAHSYSLRLVMGVSLRMFVVLQGNEIKYN